MKGFTNLVHPRVGEQQGRVIVRDTCGRHDVDVVVLLNKVVDEGLPDFGDAPFKLLIDSHFDTTSANSGDREETSEIAGT